MVGSYAPIQVIPRVKRAARKQSFPPLERTGSGSQLGISRLLTPLATVNAKIEANFPIASVPLGISETAIRDNFVRQFDASPAETACPVPCNAAGKCEVSAQSHPTGFGALLRRRLAVPVVDFFPEFSATYQEYEGRLLSIAPIRGAAGLVWSRDGACCVTGIPRFSSRLGRC